MNSYFKSLTLFSVFFFSCQVYDAPPEPSVSFPEGGAYLEGEGIEIVFSEVIDSSTLQLRLWDVERNVENEIPQNAKPTIKKCLLKKCDTSKLILKKNIATLALNEELSKGGKSYVLEVQSGLSDKEGNTTAINYFFDLQFRNAPMQKSDPVEFDNGVYILLAQVDDPIPAVLTLISDIIVLEDGTFALVGAEGDEINGDPKNTRNPENLIVDTTTQGYTVYATGKITSIGGKRTLESDTFNVTIPVGPLDVEMEGVRIFADILKNVDTGKDQIEGSLSFEKVTIINGDRRNEQGGGTTALIADFVPKELVPTGNPTLCDNNLCGEVTGKCDPPSNFPPSQICE